jgi:hypothetical protein
LSTPAYPTTRHLISAQDVAEKGLTDDQLGYIMSKLNTVDLSTYEKREKTKARDEAIWTAFYSVLDISADKFSDTESGSNTDN